MRTSMMGVAVVAGVLLVAGGAMAQTAGPTLEQPSRGIIPVTGPSTVPSPFEPAKLEVVSIVARDEVVTAEGAPKGTAGGPRVATATRKAPGTVKAVHKPATKATVKKATATKHVAKGAGPAKPRHVAHAKHRPPTHHAMVSKPIPLTTHHPPAKNATPPQPVLPRV